MCVRGGPVGLAFCIRRRANPRPSRAFPSTSSGRRNVPPARAVIRVLLRAITSLQKLNRHRRLVHERLGCGVRPGAVLASIGPDTARAGGLFPRPECSVRVACGYIAPRAEPPSEANALVAATVRHPDSRPTMKNVAMIFRIDWAPSSIPPTRRVVPPGASCQLPALLLCYRHRINMLERFCRKS